MNRKMNPEVKALWLADLRSGEHKQSPSFLNCKAGYCCMGRLTDLYIQHAPNIGNLAWGLVGDTALGEDVKQFNNCISLLPDVVAEWAGIENNAGFGPRLVNYRSLPILNDSGTSFREIADIIEEEL